MAGEHVCPWWVGYLLISPVRRLLENPHKILSPYIKEGMQVMDVGSAMGFFTLDMAKLAGDTGKVYAVDMQEKMLNTLGKRAKKAGLSDRIELRTCSKDSLGLENLKGSIDFAIVFNVVHEVSDKSGFFRQIHDSLKDVASLFLIEPKGHVSGEEFAESLKIAEDAGYVIGDDPGLKNRRAVMLKKMAKGT
ncbi:MAG: class I SAM-dependent methyltransferase [bacterium]|nr:class I SAM-dependent methyltransferase [bacterium]